MAAVGAAARDGSCGAVFKVVRGKSPPLVFFKGSGERTSSEEISVAGANSRPRILDGPQYYFSIESNTVPRQVTKLQVLRDADAGTFVEQLTLVLTQPLTSFRCTKEEEISRGLLGATRGLASI